MLCMAISPWDHVTLLLPRDDRVSLIQHLRTGNDSPLVDSRIFLDSSFPSPISFLSLALLDLRALLFDLQDIQDDLFPRIQPGTGAANRAFAKSTVDIRLFAISSKKRYGSREN